MTHKGDRKKTTAPPVAAPGYGLGFLGALIYLVQQAEGFWEVVLAVLIAMVWPVFLVYHLFKLTGLDI